MEPSAGFLSYLMTCALEEATKAAAQGEVPVGAIIASADEVLVRSHNLTESRPDSTAHAEMLAIQDASLKLKKWRLTDAILVVTLEPCSMCVSAAKLARIPLIVFGARDPRAGAIGSIYDLAADTRTGPSPRIISGILEQECGVVLKEFFMGKRRTKSQ